MTRFPKAGNPEHVRENRRAYDVHLSEAELAMLDQAFPPPTGASSLDVL